MPLRPRIPLFSRGSTFRMPTPKVAKELKQQAATTPTSTERADTLPKLERYTLQKQPLRSLAEPWNKDGNSNRLEDQRAQPTIRDEVHSNADGACQVGGRLPGAP